MSKPTSRSIYVSALLITMSQQQIITFFRISTTSVPIEEGFLVIGLLYPSTLLAGEAKLSAQHG
jgi:hypothetical protein